MAHKDFSQMKNDFKEIIEYCKGLKVGDKIKFKSEKQKYTNIKIRQIFDLHQTF